MQKGCVYRSTGSWYEVKLESGEFIQSRIKGIFRNSSIKTTNPIAVGDIVELEIEDSGQGMIKSIMARENYIIRRSVNLSKEAHIIASNLDLALLIVTISNPITSAGFIDRFTVTAQAYKIPLIIVFNKVDVYDKKDMLRLQEYEDSYHAAGYSTLRMSATKGIGIAELNEIISGKTVLLSGNSGAGKSTLINQLIPDLLLKTAELSTAHQKGKHTTTFAEMYDQNTTTRIIDTPGIKGFGLVDFEKEELALYFPEMLQLLGTCKFHNCKHINEPGCSVVAQVKSDDFSKSRYQSYLSMYKEDNTSNYRQNTYQ